MRVRTRVSPCFCACARGCVRVLVRGFSVARLLLTTRCRWQGAAAAIDLVEFFPSPYRPRQHAEQDRQLGNLLSTTRKRWESGPPPLSPLRGALSIAPWALW